MQLSNLKCQKSIYPFPTLESGEVEIIFAFFSIKNKWILFILKLKWKIYDFCDIESESKRPQQLSEK